MAKAAAIPFLEDVDNRLDFLDFFESGGLSDKVLPNAEPDLTGRRSLLEMTEPERSRPSMRTGAEAMEAISAGTLIALGFRLGILGRGGDSSS